MVYDAAHAQVVMFGGSTDGLTRLGDTWLWNGTNWTEASTTGPTPRNGSAMVYDAATSQVVLFGGVDSTGFDQNDTWVWNGTTWTNVTPASPAPSPSARSDHSDGLRRGIGRGCFVRGILPAGFISTTPGCGMGLPGPMWTPSSSADRAHRARCAGHGVRRGARVRWSCSEGPTEVIINDTWVWSGANWTQVSSSGQRIRKLGLLPTQ